MALNMAASESAQYRTLVKDIARREFGTEQIVWPARDWYEYPPHRELVSSVEDHQYVNFAWVKYPAHGGAGRPCLVLHC